MTDSLRTRIAAVQASHHHWDYAGALTCACGEDFGVDNAGWEAAVTDWAQHVADAVIRELGLRIEYGALDANNCGRSSDYDELTALPGETIKTRFITDWTTKNA